jgi:hypothetical protein
MKLKALLLAVLVAGFGASFALADDGGTDGTTTAVASKPSKPSGHGDCRRIELRGTLASATGTSFVLDVQKANDAGAALVGKQATVAVAAKALVRWESVGTFAGPAAGDQVKVLAAQCSATGNVLTAFVVQAHVPRGAAADKTAAPAKAAPADKAKLAQSKPKPEAAHGKPQKPGGDDSGESKTEAVSSQK